MTQRKTGRPVRFEFTETTRQSLDRWIADPEMRGADYLWPSRFRHSPHLSTRHYARIVRGWGASIGLEPSAYGTHSMRRTKVAHRATRSHPRSLLSTATLKSARSRGAAAISRRTRIDQTCFGWSGRFWPTTRPLFQARRDGRGAGRNSVDTAKPPVLRPTLSSVKPTLTTVPSVGATVLCTAGGQRSFVATHAP